MNYVIDFPKISMNIAQYNERIMENTARIYGKEIFFNFIEIPYSEIGNNRHLVEAIKNEKLDGFVTKNVFSLQEVEEIKSALAGVPKNEKRMGPMAELFPLPFASLSDDGERLNEYLKKAAVLEKLRSNKAIDTLLTRLGQFIATVSEAYDVKVPYVKNRDAQCVAGNFRTFFPEQGGFYVHCGYLFQKHAPFYYQVVEPMALEGQLSYFVLLQNSEIGGELTIYDMLWKDIKDKDSEKENEYVIDKDGQKVYLKDVRSFAVKPQPGDVLIFSGGPIWHRVENIKGSTSRITFGGFLNFTPDGKGLRYWG